MINKKVRSSEQGRTKGEVKGGVNQPMPKFLDKDRITMVLHFHHEHRGDQPESITSRPHIMCETKEEPYRKRYELGEEWQPLKLGDLTPDQVGFVVIDNLTGKHLVVNPTEEEKQAHAEAIVDVTYNTDHQQGSEEYFSVLPGWAMPFLPCHIDKLQIRCRKGKANIRTTVFPK